LLPSELSKQVTQIQRCERKKRCRLSARQGKTAQKFGFFQLHILRLSAFFLRKSENQV
jgi:hypothetical protein